MIVRNAFIAVGVVIAFLCPLGCEKKPADSVASGSPPPNGTAKKDDHDHATDGDKHDLHGGPVIELGTTTVNGMGLKASRDVGELKPGGDAPIDLWIDGGLGSAAAVRFWIGTENAKGSLKAKAEVEEGKWHTHTEVPDPLPTGSKLWVEIEGKDGKKAVASFDLKL